MPTENHYEILAVSETATPKQIHAAYRELVKRIHPDTVATLSPELQSMAEGATKDIIEAHRVLSDVSLRQAYDQILRHPETTMRRSCPPAVASQKSTNLLQIGALLVVALLLLELLVVAWLWMYMAWLRLH